jgi:hypothetical protein
MIDWNDLPLYALGVLDLCHSEVVRRLQIQPRSRIAAEVARQPHGSICGDATTLPDDVVDARRGDVERPGESVGTHVERNQIVLSKNFARVYWPHAVLEHDSSRLVVVDNLDVFRASRGPAKTQAELIVHADAVLPGTFAFQGFQTVTRW